MRPQEELKFRRFLERSYFGRAVASSLTGLLVALMGFLTPQFLFMVQASAQSPVPGTSGSSGSPVQKSGQSSLSASASYPAQPTPTSPQSTLPAGGIYPGSSTGSGGQSNQQTSPASSGNTSAPAAGVIAAAGAPPVVKTVPWVASNPLIPHDTWSGKVITLKGTSDSQTGGGVTFNYAWDFGDGSPVTTSSVTNQYAIQATHAYTGATGTVFTARLTVINTTTGETASKPYYVQIREKALPIEVNVAIDEGLWYLHKDMRRFNSGGLDKGDWTAGQAGGQASSTYYAATFVNLNAFEVNGHLEGGDPNNPYTETVRRSMRGMFDFLTTVSVPLNPSNHTLLAARGANPDSSIPPNGIGIQVNQGNPWYQGGMAMDAVVASGTPDAVAPTGGANIVGRTYREIVQDMVDAYAWAQYDFGSGGGWIYGANGGNDNSASQWAAIGILAAERQFGCVVPTWLKTWNLTWLDSSKGSGANLGTFGYQGANSYAVGPYAVTASGLVQLAMDGHGRGDPLWDNTETFLRKNFTNTGNYSSSIKAFYYGLFSFTKAMLLHDSNGNGIPDDGLGNEPSHITLLRSSTAGVLALDWYAAEASKGDPTDGVARTLVRDQDPGAYWKGHSWDGSIHNAFETAWAIIMLSGTVVVIRPVAVSKANPNPAVAGQNIQLDGSESFHQDASKVIDSWEWDLNNDGVYDVAGPFASVSFPALGDYPVKLRVTDNAIPETAAETTIVVRVTLPPLAPTADAGGPYVFCPGVAKWFLDGTRSSNPDEGQSEPGKPANTIIEYAWDLNGDNNFNDAFGPTPDVTAFFRGQPFGSYVIQLRVTDNTAASFPSSGRPNLTSIASAVVVVEDACDCVKDLAARPKTTKIQLTWKIFAAADHYNVYRGNTSGGPYALIASTKSTYSTYLDNSVQLGRTYYYVVRPADALDRELCQSNESSATPVNRPPVPVNRKPTANAGSGQSAVVGQLVMLDGSGSIDLDGDQLIYSWLFTSRPAGSAATLSSTSDVKPSFTLDKAGSYVIRLIVNDGKEDSLPSSVTISTINTPPKADAGPAQSVVVGLVVTLDGSKSSDVDGDPITYGWTFTDRPAGSAAALSAGDVVNPTFTVDKPGTYIARLIVNDGKAASAPATVTITTVNSPPVGDAGPAQTAFLKQTVTLDASKSSDVDGDALTYAWSFATKPVGSAAVLSDPTAVKPTFVADLQGPYVLQLLVNDGQVNSAPATVTISTQNSPPVADAGPDQSALVGQVVTLDGSKSTDVDGDALIFKWSLITRPAGSAATLSDPGAIKPTFQLDRSGTYVAQLIVNDGKVDSAPETITVSTLNSPPVASAGADQTAFVAQAVMLDGSASSDVDGDSLTFFWSFASRPGGSTAALSDNAAVKPTFTVDRPGTYVAQLIVNDGKVDSLTDTVTISIENSAPVADAGPDQTALVTQTVTLDGSKSSDVDGDALTRVWSFVSRPAGSAAVLSDPAATGPGFVADRPGTYVVQLIVNDGKVNSPPDTVSISTRNSPPVARAGADQTSAVQTTVMLDGSASSDVDGNPLTFHWSLTTRPAGSSTALSDPLAVKPTFLVDKPGLYVAQLIVNDGTVDSAPDTVSITTINSPPVASAGADQTALLNQVVVLDGSNSSDVDGDALTYFWSFVSRPAGSTAALSDPTAAKPTFTVDLPGNYVAQLIVNDGHVDSAPDTVKVATGNIAPVASAGPDQTLFVTQTATLDGSASSDVDGDPLTRTWSFVSRPAGSTAALSDPTAVKPTFVVDKPGTYVVQLIVNDGFVNSAPDSVTISTLNSKPLANAGPDRNVEIGTAVQLDGSTSSDADADPLTYRWSLTSRPAGSVATLSNPLAVNPTFTADLAGTYVAQLIVNDGTEDSAPDTVTITSAPPQVTVPNVVGLVQATAEANIVTAGLAVGIITTATSATVPAGKVISQSPAAGATVFVGSAVSLVVSLGPPPVSVPNVVGLTQAQAESAIVAANLAVGTATTAIHPTVPVGKIISQSPIAGSPVPGGSAVSFVVSLGNGLPVLASISVTPANVTLSSGQTQQFTAIGTFSDNSTQNITSTVTWTSNPLPVANITPSGLATGLDAGSAGISATKSGVVSNVASLTVNGPTLASIVVTPSTPTILAGQSQGFSAFGILTDGTSQDLTGTVTWASSTPGVATISATGIATGAGNGNTTISATRNGIPGSTQLAVSSTVTESTVPVAAITAPANNSTLTSPTDIIGTASDTNFLKYILEIAPAGDTNFTKIAEATSPVTNGVLGKFDPTMLLNDIYTVRLRVFDRGGNTTSASVNYQVALDAKVGLFSITFQDLSIPLSGIPIIVNRVYDSRDKGSGDFGFGWRLDVQSMKVRANRELGTGWRVNRVGGGFPTYQLVPTDSHKVSVTLPDGKVEEFDLTLTPNSRFLVPFDQITATFTPRAGTTGTLLALGENLLWVTGGQPGDVLLDADYPFQVPYDPQEFRYTSADGRQITISKVAGVLSAREPNGNTVTFSPNGITHSSGRSIAFIRDGQGRITRMTDPDGRFQSYAYNSNGDLVSHTDAGGNVTRFLYNLSHGLLEIRDARGIRPLRNEYDSEGRLIAQIDANGNRVEISHLVGARQEIIRNRLGFVTSYEYDANGKVIRETDAVGNVTTRTFDARGFRASETDPLGNVQTFVNDARGNVLEYRDALGNLFTSTYDAGGRITSNTDPLGRTMRYEYDAAGNNTAVQTPAGDRFESQYNAQGGLIRTKDAAGGIATYTHDASGQISGYTDPVGVQATIVKRTDGQMASEQFSVGGTPVRYSYSYDANGLLTGMTLPSGATSSLTQTASRKPSQAIDAAGNRQSVAYDSTDLVSSFTDVDGSTRSFQRDAEGRVTGLTLPGGQQLTRTLDPLGRATALTMPKGSTMTSSYDAAGRVTHQQRTGQNATVFEYDAVGRVIRSTAPGGGMTNYEWDTAGQLTALVNPLGARTEMFYDLNGNLKETRNPDLTSTVATYDALSRLTSLTNERNSRIEFGYDEASRLTQVRDAAGGITAYGLDEMGNTRTATTPSGKQWAFEYSLTGVNIARTFPWGGRETYTRDAAGRITEIRDGAGLLTTTQFDGAGRMIRRELSGGGVNAFNYDPNGQLLNATDASGSVQHTYGANGRLTRVDYPGGGFVAYEYDEAGRFGKVSTPGGTATYRYDGEGRLVEVADSSIGSATYAYDAAGRVSQAILPDGSTTTYTRNSRGWVTRIRSVSNAAVVLRDQQITNDAAGNPTTVTDLNRSVVWQYDAAGRVVGETRTGADPAADNYSYDADWNLLQIGSRTASYDTGMRLVSDGVFTSYQYDNSGRPLVRSNASIEERFTYDALGRLTEVRRTGATSAVVAFDYYHDGLIRRIAADGAGRNLLWDTSQAIPTLLEERDDAGALLRRYVHGIGPVGIAGAGGTKVLHQDMLGSIRLVTGADGSPLESYAYSAYGTRTVGPVSPASSLQFAGELFVPEVGLYFLRARFYDPTAGRFLTPDLSQTKVREPQSFNPYLYAGANPARFTDPSGRFSVVSISIGLSIASTLASIALPHFPSPIALVAKALGWYQGETELDAVGVSFALALSKGFLTGGLQIDLLAGPSKYMAVIWVFAGFQFSTAAADPRLQALITFWAGVIFGQANADPGEPRAGLYVLISGTYARVLSDLALRQGRGAARRNVANLPVRTDWSRWAAALQWEIGGISKSGEGGANWIGAFTAYGSFWGSAQSELIKIKRQAAGPRTIFAAGISITFYLPLIWFSWTPGQPIEADNWFSEL